MKRHILTLSCANKPGIVARVSAILFDGGFNILDAQQFDDTLTGTFFMRVVFNPAGAEADLAALAEFWNIAPDAAMRIPVTRRRRLVQWKVDLEKKRAQKRS